MKYIGNGWKRLGNGWGVSNLCAPSRGIPGRGPSFFLFFQKSALYIKRDLFVVSVMKNALFCYKKGHV